jgi:hypothetical protein
MAKKRKTNRKETSASTRKFPLTATGEIDVYRVLLEGAPRDKGGRQTKNTQERRKSESFRRGHNHSNSSSVLEVRLVQERPKCWEAYRRGEYKSVTAAAAAAGLIKDDADLRRAKSAFGKMGASQRQELLEWQQEVLRQEREHNV